MSEYDEYRKLLKKLEKMIDVAEQREGYGGTTRFDASMMVETAERLAIRIRQNTGYVIGWNSNDIYGLDRELIIKEHGMSYEIIMMTGSYCIWENCQLNVKT